MSKNKVTLLFQLRGSRTIVHKVSKLWVSSLRRCVDLDRDGKPAVNRPVRSVQPAQRMRSYFLPAYIKRTGTAGPQLRSAVDRVHIYGKNQRNDEKGARWGAR